GGSGDVLAGMVGALYAQVHEAKILNAALFAVLLHGSAGDSAAQEKTQIAMIAGDIIDAIPYAFKKLLKR
ncbi:MAG: NAD(P)H-hydrate dehydratase, partial [Elusimicrobiota bacterium]